MKVLKRISNASSSITRSENMARIRAVDSSIEVKLRRELWSRGLRYRKNDRSVEGKPDLVFKRSKVAVFCDSEFWHGRKMRRGEIPKTNRDFWLKKLTANIKRDRKVNAFLRKNGWLVLRFWDRDIKKDVLECADKVEAAVLERGRRYGNSHKTP